MKSVINILFINGWSDDNKGDSAIVQGLMKSLRKAPYDCRFRINSSLDLLTESEVKYHHRFFDQNDFEKISTSPLVRNGSKFKKYLSMFLVLSVAISPRILDWKWFRKFLVNFNSETYLQSFLNYKRADVVISKGGHILVSMGGLTGITTLMINILPMILGLSFKKKVVIYGQSIGPFVGAPARLIAKTVLKKVDNIILREKKSYDYVCDLIGSTDNVSIGWDTAFTIQGAGGNPLALDMKHAVITVRRWNFPENKGNSEELMDNYLDNIIQAARLMKQKYGLLPVFVPQVVGPTVLENDLTLIDEVAEKINGEFEFLAVKDDFSIEELADIYGSAEIMLGTRFHSVILSLAAGTPSLAISYYGYKTKGIMEMMELEDYVFDIYNIENIEKVIDKFMSDLPRLKGLLPEKINKIQKDIYSQAHQILQSL